MMNFNFISQLESCQILIEENIDLLGLIYYSHVATSIVALIIGTLVFFKSKHASKKALLALSLAFCLWTIFSLVTWTSIDSRMILFFWSCLGILSLSIYVISLYFTHAFLDGGRFSFRSKVLIFCLFLPIILFTPTAFNLSYFDVTNCEAREGHYFINYYYLASLFVFFWILSVVLLRYKKAQEEMIKRQVILFGVGISSFLLLFFAAGFLASLLDFFILEVYGLFGMVVFIGFLAYLIVQYKAFSIQILKAQALVVTLVLLIGAQFFFIKSQINFVLTGMTFMLAVLFGGNLISSVRRDEERKDQLQRMADHLASANDKLRELDNAKSEFISIASHQLRTPLTAIKGYISLILEGAYGKVDSVFTEVLDKVYISNERLIQLVENLLNISRMESGRMQYRFEEASLNKILSETVDAFFLSAKNKHLELKLLMPENPLPPMQLDVQKIQEAISNLIDNALKYTKEGSVTVKAEDLEKTIRVTVQDTGIGVPASELSNLFNKFSRGKDIGRLHTTGTGLGLYVVKNLVEAHGGTIHIESEGEGKGSKFVIDLPKEEKNSIRE